MPVLPDIFQIDDRFLDTEDWAFDVSVSDQDSNPINLTGSALSLTLANLADNTLVSRHQTAPGTGLAIKDGPGGIVTVTSAVADRTWRCPDGVAGLIFPQTVIGDLMRRAAPGAPYKAVQRVAITVLPGTEEAQEQAPSPEVPGGGSSAAFDYQQPAPASVWTIAHNLNARPGVSTFSVGGVEIEGEVQHLSDDVLVVSFVKPVAGYAHIV